MRGRAKAIVTWMVLLFLGAFFLMAGVSWIVNDLIPWSAPAELRGAKSAYVGDWWSGARAFHIAADGMVRCQKGFTSYGGKLIGFSGDDFTVFIALIGPSHYRVSDPPHREDRTWVMTVDGDRFERSPF